MSTPPDGPRNRLLLALSFGNLKRLKPELEQVFCQRKEILLDADSMIEGVFFPNSAVISVVQVYEDGGMIEMATIGREGCTGFQCFLGAKTSSVRLLVQIPGEATRMSRAAFTRALASVPSFRNLMQAYVHAFLEQVLLSGSCSRSAQGGASCERVFYEGQAVYDSDGNQIADINDVLLGRDDKVIAIIRGVGGVLGTGEHTWLKCDAQVADESVTTAAKRYSPLQGHRRD